MAKKEMFRKLGDIVGEFGTALAAEFAHGFITQEGKNDKGKETGPANAGARFASSLWGIGKTDEGFYGLAMARLKIQDAQQEDTVRRRVQKLAVLYPDSPDKGLRIFRQVINALKDINLAVEYLSYIAEMSEEEWDEHIAISGLATQGKLAEMAKAYFKRFGVELTSGGHQISLANVDPNLQRIKNRGRQMFARWGRTWRGEDETQPTTRD